MAQAVRLISILVWGLTCSCVSLNWSRGNLNEPIPEVAIASLRPGETDLGGCLDVLGAPNLVWEYDVFGMAMAWLWSDAGGWGFSLSYSFYRYAPAASFNYDSADDERNGVVLLFDEQLILKEVSRGNLGELLPRPPAPLPEDITGS